MSRARHFLSTSAVLFVGTAFAKVVNFLLLPFLTRSVTPAQYGYFDFWTNLSAFLAAVCFFQVWDAFYRLWFEGVENRGRLVQNGVLLFLGGAAVYLVTMSVILYYFAAREQWVILSIGMAVAVQYCLAAFVRARLQNVTFVISGIVNAIFAGSSTILLVLRLDLGLSGLFLGTLVGMVSQIVFLFVAILPKDWLSWRWHWSPDYALQRRMIRYSAPLCVASGAYWMLSGFTRLVVIHQLGADANGLYAVADRLAVVIATVVGVATYAWNEVLFTSHDSEDAADVRSGGIRAAFHASLGMGSVTLVTMCYAFPWLVSDDFSAAYALVPLTISVAVINAFASSLGSVLMADHRTDRLLTSAIVGAAVSAPLVLILTGSLGLPGALVGLNAGFVSLAMSRWLLVRPSLVGGGVGGRGWLSVAVFLGAMAFYWMRPGELGVAILVCGMLLAALGYLWRRRVASY